MTPQELLDFTQRHKKFIYIYIYFLISEWFQRRTFQPVYARWNFSRTNLSRTNTQGSDLLVPSLDLDLMAGFFLRSDHAVVSKWCRAICHDSLSLDAHDTIVAWWSWCYRHVFEHRPPGTRIRGTRWVLIDGRSDGHTSHTKSYSNVHTTAGRERYKRTGKKKKKEEQTC